VRRLLESRLRALEQQPGELTHGELALAAEASSLWALAEQHFALAAEQSDAPGGWSLHRAISLEGLGRTEEATALLAQAAAQLDDWPGAWQRLGVWRLEEGQLAAAREAMTRARDLAPEHPVPWIGLSRIELLEDDAPAALAAARRAGELGPGLEEAHNALGRALLASGDEEQARASLLRGQGSQRIFLGDPLQRRVAAYQVGRAARTRRARAHLSAGRTSQARAEVDALLADYPEVPDVLVLSAAVHFKAQRHDLAEAQLEAALSIDPAHGRALADRALLALGRGELASAEEDARAARDALPEDVEVRRVLAHVLRSRGDDSAALEELLAARVMAPAEATLLFELGTVSASLSDHLAAAGWFEELLRLEPDHVEARVRLAVLALHLARWDVAQAQVEWLERHASSHPKLQLLRSELERERPR